MKKFLATLCLTLAVSISSFAQQINNEINKANHLLQERGEVYFSFSLNDQSQIESLSRIISIDDIKGRTVYAYANMKEFLEFTKKGIEIQVLTPPSMLVDAAMSSSNDQPLAWDYYPTYSNYENIMSQFVADHPDIARLITIGTLSSGRKLLAVKISDNPDVEENEPEFLYTSSIHGDETTGYILLLHLIDYLLTNYSSNDRITDLVNGIEIYINPLANPDGTYHGGNNTVNGATRYNANSIDLNRNYPDPEDGQHPDGNAWQPETIAFMNFAQQHTFTMSANFHGGTEVLNYPWDTWPRLAADNSWWIYVCREYADTVHLHAPANYMNEYVNGITNGYAWYTISGGRQDYMNYFRHCREVTAEISDTKLLPANQLLSHWEYNYRSLLNYLNQSIYGLHGLVTDSITGEPLPAKIFISGFDIDSSNVYTDPDVGDYHRLLKAGTYNVTFSSTGYLSKTFTVQIADKQKVTLNVQLFDGSLIPAFTADKTNVNPGAEIQFTDKSAGSPTGWYWEFEGGTPATSSAKNPVVSYYSYGLFDVKLKITRQNSSDSVVMADYISVSPNYIQGNYYLATCHGNYYDSGNDTSNYPNDEITAMTFLPESPGKKITVYFTNFDIEPSNNCTNDRLSVYDGNSTVDPLIGSYCGTSVPESITATNPTGALTLLFVSNATVTAPGWSAYVVCSPNTGITEPDASVVSIFPNPAPDGQAVLVSQKLIRSLKITDSRGRTVSSLKPDSYRVKIQEGLSAGLYYISVQAGEQWYVKKFQVVR